jgi:hypothetical protein
MYSEQYFRVRMDPRPEGLWVVVSHLPTGRELVEGPVESGMVKAVTRRLIETMQRELVLPLELRIGTGLALGGQFIMVEHVPTGRVCSAPARGKPLRVRQQLVDQLITELWEEGLLAVPPIVRAAKE